MIDSKHQKLCLDTISIGLTARIRNVSGKIGIVHSVFEKVINISIGDHLISIVGKMVGNGSLNIVVNNPDDLDFRMRVKRGDTVTLGETINIEKDLISISTKDAKVWRPRINFQERLQAPRIILENITILRDSTLLSGKIGGLGALIESLQLNDLKFSIKTKLDPIAQFAAPHISSLLQKIKMNQVEEINRYSNKIVGLGPGLTPSGDDMLIGLMISMIYISENINININVDQINKNIISGIADRTTDISVEFLREAAIGRVNEPLSSLMENLLTSGQGKIVKSIKKVFSLGSTSGVDTIFGVIIGSSLMMGEYVNHDK